jgi:DnaJ-class molecular chaperone
VFVIGATSNGQLSLVRVAHVVKGFDMTPIKCIGCAGKGYIWGRTRINEKGHMAKRKCGYCKGTGETKVKKEPGK